MFRCVNYVSAKNSNNNVKTNKKQLSLELVVDMITALCWISVSVHLYRVASLFHDALEDDDNLVALLQKVFGAHFVEWTV